MKYVHVPHLFEAVSYIQLFKFIPDEFVTDVRLIRLSWLRKINELVAPLRNLLNGPPTFGHFFINLLRNIYGTPIKETPLLSHL